eukprot:364923-Chlamydomonas_euryale.AAC.4
MKRGLFPRQCGGWHFAQGGRAPHLQRGGGMGGKIGLTGVQRCLFRRDHDATAFRLQRPEPWPVSPPQNAADLPGRRARLTCGPARAVAAARAPVARLVDLSTSWPGEGEHPLASGGCECGGQGMCNDTHPGRCNTASLPCVPGAVADARQHPKDSSAPT